MLSSMIYTQITVDAVNKCTWRIMVILITGITQSPLIKAPCWGKKVTSISGIACLYLWLVQIILRWFTNSELTFMRPSCKNYENAENQALVFFFFFHGCQSCANGNQPSKLQIFGWFITSTLLLIMKKIKKIVKKDNNNTFLVLIPLIFIELGKQTSVYILFWCNCRI